MREGWCEIKLAQCVNNITKFYEIKTTNYEMAGNYPIVSQSEDLIAGYTDDDKTLLVCVMSNKEFYKMKELIHQIDEKAFVYVTKACEVHGEGFTPELTPDIEDN